MSAVDPRYLSILEWCEFTTPLIKDRAAVPRLLTPDDWRSWALTVLQSPQIARYNPPDPLGFEQWQDWAFRFNQAVPL